MRFKISFLFIIFALQLNITYGLAVDDSLTLHGNELQFANNIILTIDDASIEENVRAIFNLLKAQGVTATFFPNTRYVTQQDPQLWQEIVAAGSEIGYHTRRHTSGMTTEELAADFAAFQDEIRVALNDPSYTIRYVRPPNGLWNDNWMSWASANSLITVRWNVTDVTDDMGYLESVLKSRDRGGSIILLHTGQNDVQWVENHLSALMGLLDEQSNPYHLSSLSRAWDD